ncbi:unnamed protein product [Paramecium octaurelia]|uniref:Transmembrane protein n=1 Tax=Paramecium octaurelia TaxID=43137 RepID=A0A8S1WGH6_PAROT|nr:unnamed protein product [Paramecium octaurelia]
MQKIQSAIYNMRTCLIFQHPKILNIAKSSQAIHVLSKIKNLLKKNKVKLQLLRYYSSGPMLVEPFVSQTKICDERMYNFHSIFFNDKMCNTFANSSLQLPKGHNQMDNNFISNLRYFQQFLIPLVYILYICCCFYYRY